MEAVLVMTVKEMQDEANWLKARKMGIGGSDASAVIGMNRYKTQRQVWQEKLSDEMPDQSDNQFIYWGHALEPVIADWFSEKTGKKVRKAGLMQNYKHPFMIASVDRLVVGEDAGLEIKTASGFKAKEWEGQEVPDEYYIQCQHYMAVTGLSKWYIAVLLGGNNAIWKEIPRNEEDIATLIELEKNFWNMVQNKIEPEATTAELDAELKKQFSQGNGSKEAAILDEDASDNAEKYVEIKAKMDELKQELLKYEVALKEAMEDSEVGLAGEYEVKWSTVKGRTTLDSKAIKKDLPDVFEKYSKVGAPTRRFSVGILEG